MRFTPNPMLQYIGVASVYLQLYEEQIFVGVFAETQARCQLVLH